MTWDSDATNLKGAAGQRNDSSSGMMTRSSMKKGKIGMKRKLSTPYSVVGLNVQYGSN
jgi:hypothetical protein